MRQAFLNSSAALAVTLLSAVCCLHAADVFFTHGPDIYAQRDPQGPGTTVSSDAYLRTVSLNGTNTRRSEWLQMNSGNYPAQLHGGGVGGGAWQHPLPPNTTFLSTGNSARLYRGTLDNLNPSTAGGGSPGGTGGIYSYMTQASFLLWEDTPVADLETVVFQAYLTTGSSPNGDVIYGVDGDFSILPSLIVIREDGTRETFTAEQSFAELYESREATISHTGGGFEFDVDIFENYRSYRWDISDLSLATGEIVRFGIEFEIEPHVALRSISLDQAGGMIPEPSDIALLLGLAVGARLFFRRRK